MKGFSLKVELREAGDKQYVEAVLIPYKGRYERDEFRAMLLTGIKCIVDNYFLDNQGVSINYKEEK